MNSIEQSRFDTEQHKSVVNQYITKLTEQILIRGLQHDNSKLTSPEIEIFAEYSPKLAKLTYNSEEYKQHLKEMQVALDHHYAHNRHHPEHHPNGVSGMNILDLVEMLCDWKASSIRQHNGNLLQSIDKNKERFGYSDDLASIMKNTAELFELI